MRASLGLLLLPLLLHQAEAAKGGAKSVMNRRKNQQNRGGGYDFARNRHFDEGYEGSGGGEESSRSRGPCVGLCLHMKEHGLTLPPPPLHPPCVGVCQHRRQLGIVIDQKEEARRRGRKPCIGLCYIEKVA